MYYIPQPSQLPARAHNSHWVADRSIQFLTDRDRSRPFLLWSSFIHPHPPFAPPVPWNKLYRAPSMPLPKRPPDMRNLWTTINRIQNRYKYRDAGIDDNLLRVMKAYYYAAVSFIDYNVGRILEALEQCGELENTLVLWSSDHGEFLGDYDCFGKRTFLRSTANVPLIVRHPDRFPAGARVDTPASLVDIMPTACEILGIECPQGIEGRSLKPLLTGNAFDRFPSVSFAEFMSGQRAVRMGSFKAIYKGHVPFVYDLSNDPKETRNIAREQPVVLSGLRDAFGRQMERFSDSPLPAARKRAPRHSAEDVTIDPETRRQLRALGYMGDD